MLVNQIIFVAYLLEDLVSCVVFLKEIFLRLLEALIILQAICELFFLLQITVVYLIYVNLSSSMNGYR